MAFIQLLQNSGAFQRFHPSSQLQQLLTALLPNIKSLLLTAASHSCFSTAQQLQLLLKSCSPNKQTLRHVRCLPCSRNISSYTCGTPLLFLPFFSFLKYLITGKQREPTGGSYFSAAMGSFCFTLSTFNVRFHRLSSIVHAPSRTSSSIQLPRIFLRGYSLGLPFFVRLILGLSVLHRFLGSYVHVSPHPRVCSSSSLIRFPLRLDLTICFCFFLLFLFLRPASLDLFCCRF